MLNAIDLHVAKETISPCSAPTGWQDHHHPIMSTLIRANGGQVAVAGHNLATHPQAIRRPSASPADTRPWTSSSPARRTSS